MFGSRNVKEAEFGLSKALDALTQRIVDLSESNGELKGENRQLSSEVRSLKNSVAALRDQVSCLERERERLLKAAGSFGFDFSRLVNGYDEMFGEAILNPAYKKLLNAVPGAPLDAWPDEAKRRFYYVRVGAESLVKRPETEE